MTSLQTLYAFYKYSEQSVLPPDEVRVALSALHAQKDGRFALGQQDDANECFEAILMQIHRDACGGSADDDDERVCCAAHHVRVSLRPPFLRCAAHHCFGLSSFDQYECAACRASSEPQVTLNFVYRVAVIELLNAASRAPSGGGRARAAAAAAPGRSRGARQDRARDRRRRVVGAAAAVRRRAALGARGEPRVQRLLPLGVGGARRRRARACTRARLRRRLLGTPPPVFALNLLWSSDRVDSGAQLAQLLRLVSLELRVPSVFAREADAGAGGAAARRRRLAGVVCYYGRHWVSFFPSPGPSGPSAPSDATAGASDGGAKAEETWLLFDDAQVREVAPLDARATCGRSR